VSSQKHSPPTQSALSGQQTPLQRSRPSGQKGAHRPLAWHRPEQHCRSRTHPPSGAVQVHLPSLPHTLLQQAWLSEQSDGGPRQTHWAVWELHDPAQHVQGVMHFELAQLEQADGSTSAQLEPLTQCPPQGIVPAGHPRHACFLRLQRPEAHWRLRRQFPPVGRRQALAWQTASVQSAQSPSVLHERGPPMPGQVVAASTRIRPSASPASAARSACNRRRREGPPESAQLRASKRSAFTAKTSGVARQIRGGGGRLPGRKSPSSSVPEP